MCMQLEVQLHCCSQTSFSCLSLTDYTQWKANLKKRRCVHKGLVQDVLCPIVFIVGQKALENGWRLRCGSWKREFDFLKHLLLVVEWILSQEGKLILCLGTLWSLPDILLGFDLNRLSQIGSYIRKNKTTHFNLPTMPLCAWLWFSHPTEQAKLKSYKGSVAELKILVENFRSSSLP